MRMHAPCLKGRNLTGYSLLELSVVLAVIGTLALGLGSQMDAIGQAREQYRAEAELEQARQALRTYLLRNHRLPCPQSGRAIGPSANQQGRMASSCSAQAGWLPYLDIGLELPTTQRWLAYAVHRSSDIDLVQPTGSAHDDIDMEGKAAIEQQLARLVSIPPSATEAAAHHSRKAASASNACTGADMQAPAFVLIAPGHDFDGDGQRFDGINSAFAAGTSSCLTAPGTPLSTVFDDQVVSESATALLGWLLQKNR